MEWLLLVMGVASLTEHAAASSHVALEAEVGSTVELPCPSNDDDHRFQFWQLVGDEIIGPGNAMDRTKYKYDVLTGKLYIRDVTTAESGFYKCVTKQVTGNGLYALPVELVVRKDWEDEYETDHSTNVYRAIVVILVLVALIIVGVFVYMYYTGQRSFRLRRLVEEESPNIGYVRRGTYNPTTIPSTSKFSNEDAQRFEHAVIDTSFPSEFRTLESTSSM